MKYYKIWMDIEEVDDTEGTFEIVGQPIGLDTAFDSFEEADEIRQHIHDTFELPKWTVILQYPEGDIYVAWVIALDPDSAIKAARYTMQQEGIDEDLISYTEVLIVARGFVETQAFSEECINAN